MPFGMVSGVGLGICVLDFGGDRRRGRGSFGGEFGHPIVTNGAVHEPIELVSGVGSGIDVLGGGPRA